MSQQDNHCGNESKMKMDLLSSSSFNSLKLGVLRPTIRYDTIRYDTIRVCTVLAMRVIDLPHLPKRSNTKEACCLLTFCPVQKRHISILHTHTRAPFCWFVIVLLAPAFSFVLPLSFSSSSLPFFFLSYYLSKGVEYSLRRLKHTNNKNPQQGN